jgi:hypothetical protein
MMVAAQAEQTKANADMLAQENKKIELQIKVAGLQTNAEGNAAKLQSEILTNARTLEQNQEKIDNDKSDKDYKNALSAMELELQYQKDLNTELQNNLQIAQ